MTKQVNRLYEAGCHVALLFPWAQRNKEETEARSNKEEDETVVGDPHAFQVSQGKINIAILERKTLAWLHNLISNQTVPSRRAGPAKACRSPPCLCLAANVGRQQAGSMKQKVLHTGKRSKRRPV